MSNQNTSPNVYVPQLAIPFSVIDPKIANLIIPRQIDLGLFHLRLAKNLDLNIGSYGYCKTGLILHISKFIDMSPCYGIAPNTKTTVFPRVVLQVRIASIYDVIQKHGIKIVAPEILTSDTVNDRELELYVHNIGNKICCMKAGDEIAQLSINFAPLSAMVMVDMEKKDE